MTRTVPVPTPDDLEHARRLVRQHLALTPFVSTGTNTWLKLETFQPTGAFKVRGALVALDTIGTERRIVTASAGNHALGVAWASRTLGVPATIVVAKTAAPVKIEKLRALNADLVLHGSSYDEAEEHAIEHAARGGHFLSGYNDTQVIAGQATVLDEILNQLPDDDQPLSLFVPVGGGGLLSGISLHAATITDRDIRLVGVEAKQSLAASTSIAAGRTIEVPVGDTLADGLSGNVEQGSVTVDILREQGVDMTSVSEEEIRESIRWLFHEHGLVAEGASATAISAMRRTHTDGHAVAVVTGRNITWPVLREILDKPGHRT